jgi:signal transduction histidine kinase
MRPESALHKRNGHRKVPRQAQASAGDLLRLIHSATDQRGPTGGGDETSPLPEAVARAVERSRAAFDRGELADVRATLDVIQAQADLAARVVAQLVDVVRASFARSYEPTTRQLVSLNDLVVEALGERARAGGGVSTALDPKLPSVAADPRQIRHVLHTLLVALVQEREASGGASPITVRTSRAAGVLQGEHIARVALAGAAGQTPPAGTLTVERWPDPALALELSLASRVVNEHGGVLEATSAPGSLRFTLELPSL